MNDIDLISEARLKTFGKFTRDKEKARELHDLTLQVGASLMAVIALIELSLRNSVDLRLRTDFGEKDWLQKPPFTFEEKEERSLKIAKVHAQKAQYSKLTYKQKQLLDTKIYPHGIPPNIKHETLSRKRWETFDPHHNQLIAQTTIFFWKRLFSSDYSKSLWEPSLRKLFPQKHVKRSEVTKQLERIYLARNRIAHHDPVYGDRLDAAFEAVKFLRDNFVRRKSEESDFQRLTEIQYHRLYIDYISFKKNWGLLSS